MHPAQYSSESDGDNAVVYNGKDERSDSHSFGPKSLTQIPLSQAAVLVESRRRRKAVRAERGSTRGRESLGSADESVCAGEVDPFALLEDLVDHKQLDSDPKKPLEEDAMDNDDDDDQAPWKGASECPSSGSFGNHDNTPPHNDYEVAAGERQASPTVLYVPSLESNALEPPSSIALKKTTVVRSPNVLPASNNTAKESSGVSYQAIDTDHYRNVLKASRRHARQADVSAPIETANKEWPKRVGVVRAKHSIVGSRPQHWGLRDDKTQGNFSFSRKLKVQVAAELSKATVRSRMKPTMHSVPSKREDSSEPPDSQAATAHTPSSSFLPTFLSTSIVSAGPSIEETDDAPETTPRGGVASSFDRVTTNGAFSSSEARSPPVFSSPPVRKQKGGKLSNRLKAVRSGILGDVIRLQSGQYPFREKQSMFDMNDPRARAQSYMDVSFLGDATVFATENNHSSQQLAIRGRVHQHLLQSSQQPCPPNNCVAWFVFSSDSVRTFNLQYGSMLRIYNAVAITIGEAADWIISCTDLCEAYPSDVLPKLNLPVADDMCIDAQTK